MKKKLLSLLLAITLIIGTLPISASAATYDFSSIKAWSTFNSGDTITNSGGWSKINISINNSAVATVANGGTYNVPYRMQVNFISPVFGANLPGSCSFSQLYTVTFDKQGKGNDIPSQEVAHGSTITAPNSPTDTGYTFMGWYKDSAYSSQWDFSADKVTSDMTLYAKWEKKFVPVTNITGVPTTGTVGTALTLTGTVEPSGATNQTITWSVKDDGTTGATLSGTTLSVPKAGTVTVTATVENGSSSTTNYTQDFEITINRNANKVATATAPERKPTKPWNKVNKDQKKILKAYTFFEPNRSSKYPPGSCATTYDQPKAEKI